MATATLIAGRDGGRAHHWIAGEPQGFSRQYVFPPHAPLEIDDADAAKLQAGKIALNGRVFEVTRDPAPVKVDTGKASGVPIGIGPKPGTEG